MVTVVQGRWRPIATFWNALLSCGVAFPAGAVSSLLTPGRTGRTKNSALRVRADGDFAAGCDVDPVVHTGGQFNKHSGGRVSAGESDFRNGGAPFWDAVRGAGGAPVAGDGSGN